MEWVADVLRVGGAGGIAGFLILGLKMWLERDLPKASVMETANSVAGSQLERMNAQLEAQDTRLEEAFIEIRKLDKEVKNLRYELRVAEDYAYDAAGWIEDARMILSNAQIIMRPPPLWRRAKQNDTESIND